MRLAALCLALLGVLVFAPAAEAYKRFGYHWPTKTIKYFDATGKEYKKEVAAAASAWNKSGAKVRWKRVSKRGSGVVPITVTKKIPTAGLATVSYGGGRFQGLIQVQPGLKKYGQTELSGSGVAAQIVAHEMGHIMGLDHETKKCAVMQPAVGTGCPGPTIVWQYRCRILEKDDVRGGVAIFGGKVGKIGPEFCDAVSAPEAPTDLTVTPVPANEEEETDEGVQVGWTTPKGKELESVDVMRKLGSCPTGPEDRDAVLVDSTVANSGQAQTSIDDSGFAVGGTYCYAVFALGKLNRPGRIATVMYTAPPSAKFKPSADFDYGSDFEDPQNVSFFDESFAQGQASIVAWKWDFADGTTSTEQNPVHRFAPGEHSVVLTVTDSNGQTASVTRTVFVEEPPPPDS